MIIILSTDEARAYLRSLVAGRPDPIKTPYRGATVLRPQTSGPCVHIDQGAEDDPEAVQALGLACRHPGRTCRRDDECPQEWECPHLNTPDVLCSVRDACYAMGEVARLRSACEAEQEGQDQAMAADMLLCPVCDGEGSTDSWGVVERCSFCHGDGAVTPDRCEEYHRAMTAAGEGRLYTYEVEPEIPEPTPEEDPDHAIQIPPQAKRKDAWNEGELRAVARVDTSRDAVTAYRATFPDADRSDGAIRAMWRKLRGTVQKTPTDTPTPDFAGDTVPVTRCEKIDPDEADPGQMVGDEAPSQGFYGDRRAYEADLMDGMMCDEPLSQEPGEAPEADTPHSPWLGMRVRVLDPRDLLNRTGTVVEYNLDLREMLVALDDSHDRVWLPPESLLLIGAGRVQA